MKKIIFLLFAFALLPGCKTRDLSCFEKRPLDKTQLPPNCVRIKENLFIDKTEICNIDYREHLYWVKRVYGLDSYTYNQCLPDSSVWGVFDSYQVYLHFPGFDSYPFVGVSYDQAKDFCDWRADRVYEITLIRLGKIQPNPAQDSANHFTVERYRSGKYGVPDLSVPIPRFRLPTESEWELAASGGLDTQKFPYGYDFDSPFMQKMSKRYQHLLYTKEAADSRGSFHELFTHLPTKNEDLFKNNFGIYNMIGNVAEMVSERGIAKGGSYTHPVNECVITNKFVYEKPTNWLGFRCVCSWEQE